MGNLLRHIAVALLLGSSVAWAEGAQDGAQLAEPTVLPAQDYKPDAGPFKVKVEQGEWVDPKRKDRRIPWKLYRPNEGLALPVVVWSHGLGGSRNGAEYLGRHLASHGYAAFHLQHAGSDAAVLRGGRDTLIAAARNPQVSLQRFLDVPFAVGRIRAINNAAGSSAGRFDLNRMGMSGHSFGAISTLAAAGQQFGSTGINFGVPDFKGAFAMSPSPPRIGSASAAFGRMLMPIFHLTGTEDGWPLGEDMLPIDRRVPYDTINDVDQYLLILDKGVHMTFSGRRHPRYPELERHLTLIRMAAVAFWDTVLKDDTQARAWLQDGGFAAATGDAGTFEFKRPGAR